MTLEVVLFILQFFSLSFLITLPFLYDLNARFRYYFKFLVYYGLFALVNVVVAPIAKWIWAPICGSSPSILSFLHRAIGYLLNIRWKVIEEKASNVDLPCIFVVNQQNSVDILGVYNALTASRRNTIIRFQRHRDYFADFIRLISFCCPILTCTTKDFATVVHSTLDEIHSKKANVWIFCENIRELDTNVLDSALRQGVPVIPLIFSHYYFIDSQKEIFDPGYIYVKVLPQVSHKDTSIDEESNVKSIQSLMETEFKTLSAKVTPPTLEELWQSYW